jgi:broad specificity phosphatase PhoE
MGREHRCVASIVLVRHAEPLITEGTPPARWRLTDQGRADARVLGDRLGAPSATTVVWTSPERKARETAEHAFPASTSRIREELCEVKKPWFASADQHEQAVSAYLRGERVQGWEHRQDVMARLGPLRSDIRSGERLLVVSHGLLLTTWLDHECGLSDPFSFWSALEMPDAWELDLEEKSLQRIM